MIYASLGTLQNGLDHLFQAILDACAGLPVRLVLALGRENGSVPARVPANATVLGYAPQLALLRRASLVITHAGLNTTLEALSHGLPLVALPIANDQPGVAARIRYAGIGEWLASRGLSPARLRTVIQQVLSQPCFRSRARECAESIARARGLSRAAEIVEEALMGGTRIRVSRPKAHAA